MENIRDLTGGETDTDSVKVMISVIMGLSTDSQDTFHFHIFTINDYILFYYFLLFAVINGW